MCFNFKAVMGLVTTLTLAVCVVVGRFLEAVSAQTPVFTTTCPYNVKFSETVSNTIFDKVQASNTPSFYKKDETGNGNYFSVNKENGSLSVTTVDVDTLQQNVFNVTIIANNSAGAANCLLTITVEDVNDNSPVFGQQEYSVNLKDHVNNGSSVINVTATDNDWTSPNDQIVYSLNGTNKDDFAINATAGLVTVKANNLTAAVTKNYMLQILAVDGGTPKNTGTANLNVCVGCESDGRNGKMGQAWSSAAFIGSLVSLILLQEM